MLCHTIDNNERSIVEDCLLYENHDLIIINKLPDIPIYPPDFDGLSLLESAESFCGHPLKVAHAIDRPCSGIVIFTKNKHASIQLSKQFNQRILVKKYLAVISKSKKLPPSKTLEDKVFFDKKKQKSYIRSWMEDGGKLAKLNYHLIDVINKYALIEVDPVTDRKHQIRAQLSHLGYPIKGDTMYGFKHQNKDNSIQLHAWKVYFRHPRTEEQTSITVNPPENGVWKHFTEHR